MRNYTFRLTHLFLWILFLSFSEGMFAQTPQLMKAIDVIKHHNKYPDYVLVAAHRGYWANYPENTIPAYEQAIELDADMVELDIRFTRDSVMVVFHDAALDRMTNSYGLLRDEYWSEVKKMKLYNHSGQLTDYGIMTLSEALDFLKNKAVIALDVKEKGKTFERALEKAMAMAKEKGVLYQCIVKGKMTQQQMIALNKRLGITFKDYMYTPVTFANVPNLDVYLKEWMSNPDVPAIQLGYKQSADPLIPYVEQVKKANKWVGIFSFWPQSGEGVVSEKVPLTDTDLIYRMYDFQDKNPNNFLDDGRGDWDWVFKHGADYVITDRSDVLIDYLQAQGKRIK